VPESNPHRDATEHLRQILARWLERTGLHAQVVSNLAVRWDPQHPKTGLDPDIALLHPPPPEGESVGSLLLWKPGHHVPPLAIEIVSPTNPHKDYQQAPHKYASLGVTELWVVDLDLAGPAAHGGPYRLQVWSRSDEGGLTRVYAGEGPAYSPYLQAWVVVRFHGLQRRIRIADDADGRHLWPTPVEVERRAKDAALARIAELEAELAAARKKEPAA